MDSLESGLNPNWYLPEKAFFREFEGKVAGVWVRAEGHFEAG